MHESSLITKQHSLRSNYLDMYQGGEDIGAIVADIGSYATRIGYAGEDSPRAFIPSVRMVQCGCVCFPLLNCWLFWNRLSGF